MVWTTIYAWHMAIPNSLPTTVHGASQLQELVKETALDLQSGLQWVLHVCCNEAGWFLHFPDEGHLPPTTKIMGFAFVDDTDLWITHQSKVEQVVIQMQKAMTHWEGLLWVTGGVLVLFFLGIWSSSNTQITSGATRCATSCPAPYPYLIQTISR